MVKYLVLKKQVGKMVKDRKGVVFNGNDRSYRRFPYQDS